MDQLTLGAWNVIRETGAIIVRTADHPIVEQLAAQGIRVESYDRLYEEHASFPDVYAAIAEDLLRRAASASRDTLYGVPGHPSVAEASVRLLKTRCAERGIPCRLIGGESFLDQAFLRLGFDPVEGLLLLDAGEVTPARIQPELHLVVTQVYDRFTASETKLALLEHYPPDYEIVLASGLGMGEQERIERLPLEDLDRRDRYGNHAMVWVPRSDEPALRSRSFERLREIVEILRSPEGCPWDREQTHESIRKNLIEETCEVLETIDRYDPEGMCEELGDLLLQIMLHAQMEAEAGMFAIGDVIQGLNEKLIRRHPHVFGDQAAGDAGEALSRWEQVKAQEKKAKGLELAGRSLLDGVPPALPGSLTALEYQKRAAKVGFDWDNVQEAFDKLLEETAELRELIAVPADESQAARQHEELGDVLFSVVNIARFLNIDPESAMAAVNRKFYERFRYMEERLQAAGKTFRDVDLAEMERLWQEAKRQV
jgi:tetrapyrrole methylase family protein/MazG family protein